MSTSYNSEKKMTAMPFCQATGCFMPADTYIVLKETEEPIIYDNKENLYSTKDDMESPCSDVNFDGFKIILYFCERHDRDFKYLINGSELRISKKCLLHREELKELG